MRKKMKLLAILSEVIMLSVLYSCSNNKENSGKDDEIYKIGINQIVQHSALDSAREGFIDGLKEKGYVDGENIEIDYENSYAYSDSKHDLPMLKLVKNRYLVNKKNGEIKWNI